MSDTDRKTRKRPRVGDTVEVYDSRRDRWHEEEVVRIARHPVKSGGSAFYLSTRRPGFSSTSMWRQTGDLWRWPAGG